MFLSCDHHVTRGFSMAKNFTSQMLTGKNKAFLFVPTAAYPLRHIHYHPSLCYHHHYVTHSAESTFRSQSFLLSLNCAALEGSQKLIPAVLVDRETTNQGRQLNRTSERTQLRTACKYLCRLFLWSLSLLHVPSNILYHTSITCDLKFISRKKFFFKKSIYNFSFTTL